MSITYNSKILLKRGYGDPSTSLLLGEPGFDISTNRLFIGKGEGIYALPVIMEHDMSSNTFKFVTEASLGQVFYWNNGLLDISTAEGLIGEASIGFSLYWNNGYLDVSDYNALIKDISLGNVFFWNDGKLDISVGSGGGITESSIGNLYWNNGKLDSSTTPLVSFIDFDPKEMGEEPSFVEGRLYYDEEHEALTFVTDEGVPIQLSKEIYIKVFNDTGSTIERGKVVYLSNYDTSAFANIELAQANDSFNPNSVIAIAKHDISANAFGFVLSYGIINGIDTSAFSTGSTLYLSQNVAGALVDSPETPKRTILVARVIYSGTNGRILVDTYARANSDFLAWNNVFNTAYPYDSLLDASIYSLTGSKGKLFRGVEVLDSSMVLNYNGMFKSYNLESQNSAYLKDVSISGCLFLRDSSSCISTDSSGNITFRDAIAGTFTLLQLTGVDTWKPYVDASLYQRDLSINSKVSKEGDVMTGSLVVEASALISDVLINNKSITNLDYIKFNSNYSPIDASRSVLYWDSSEFALSYRTENPETIIQIGQENVIRGYNNGIENILNGQVVRISGSFNGYPTFSLASADVSLFNHTIAVATDDILVGGYGYATVNGIVRDIDTSSFDEGDRIYLGSVPGSLTNVEPLSPMATVIVGNVLRKHVSNGKIFVSILAVPILESISDVSATNVDIHSVIWKQSSNLWEAVPLQVLNSNLSISDSSDAASYPNRTYVDGSLNDIRTNYTLRNDFDASIEALDTCVGSKMSGNGDPGKVAIWTGTKFINHDDNLVYDISNHRLGIGPVSLDSSNPASLTIDSGLITSINAITAFGNVNDYYQINLQNTNAGNNSSTDLVVTASNGDEESFYVDMGINSPSYTGGFGGEANDAYLLSNAENLIITNIVPGKNILISIGGEDSYATEKMRITSDGSVFIGSSSGTYLLDVNGDINSASGIRIGGVSLYDIFSSISYVDGSLFTRDQSINKIDASVLKLYNYGFLKEGSIGNDFWWNGNVLDISTSFKNQVANVGSGQYNPFYQKVGTVNQFRSLRALNGLIITTDTSTSFLDASINIPASISITGVPFSGNLNETFQRIFYVDKSIREKTSNTVSEIAAAGVTQLAANTDQDSSQGSWFPWGSTTWDPSGTSSLISWNDWLVFYSNTQTVIRSSFTLDVSSFEDNVYAIYFDNTSETPVLTYSTSLQRRAYSTKAYIGHIATKDGSIRFYHESPDVYGTPSVTRDRNSYGVNTIEGMVIRANSDGSTLSVTAGSYLLEGTAFRNIDFYTPNFLGSQHIENRNYISKLMLGEINPSTGYWDTSIDFYDSILTFKNRYYDSSSNTLQDYIGTQKFVLGAIYSLDSVFSLVRRGKLYDTLAEAESDISNFESTSSSISTVTTSVHPKLGYFIIATDCSTINDESLFVIKSTIVSLSGGGGGGGGTGGVVGATNIGTGFGVYESILSDILQFKRLNPGSSNTIKISSTADTILFDTSIKDYDASINSLYNIKTDKTYTAIQDASILSFDLSINTLTPFNYVDGSLFDRDLSINWLFINKPSFEYVDGSLVNIRTTFSTLSYVDGSLLLRDASLEKLFNTKADRTYVDGSLNNIRTTYASLTYVNGQLAERDSSITVLFNTRATYSYVDSSITERDSSIQKLFSWEIAQDASIISIRNLSNIHDASIGFLNSYRIVQDSSISSLTSRSNIHDASIGFLNSYRIVQDSSISFLSSRSAIHDSSLGFFNTYRSIQDSSIAAKVWRSGDTMTGSLTINASLNVNGSTNIIGNIDVSGLTRLYTDVSIGGSLTITNCSSIGNNLPYAQIDVSNGNKIVRKGNYYGQEFQYAQDLTTTNTTDTTPTYTTKLTITTPTSLPAGTYRISASYAMNKAVTNSDMLSRIQVDGTTLGDIHNHELSDTTTWIYASRFMITALTSGSHTITLQFSQESAGTISMRDCTLEIIRVS